MNDAEMPPPLRDARDVEREMAENADAMRDLMLVLHFRHLHRRRLHEAPKAELPKIVAELDEIDGALDDAYEALLGRLAP